MIDNIRHLFVGITLAVFAFLNPIGGELFSLVIVFFLNFFFGYLSGMIANHEDFDFKKAIRCGAEATVFFVLCTAIYSIGKLKHQYEGAIQCVSFITYVVLYFYGLNILKNLKKIFKKGSTPWQIVAFLYYMLRFKFIERIPGLAAYLNYADKAALLLCIFALSLQSCSSPRQVVPLLQSNNSSRDSIVVDTIWRDRYVEHVIRDVQHVVSAVSDSTSVIVDSAGRVLRTDHWRTTSTASSSSKESLLRDSLRDLRLQYKTLLSMKADSMEVPVPVERKATLLEHLQIILGKAIVVAAYVVLLFFLMVYARSKWK